MVTPCVREGNRERERGGEGEREERTDECEKKNVNVSYVALGTSYRKPLRKPDFG